MSDETTTFLEAAAMFAGLCAEIHDQQGDQWARPGLGEWDVRALAGHTLRAVTTVRTYLAEPPPDELACDSAAAYFVLARTLPGADDRAVADRGRQAGEALGPDPAASVRAEVERTRGALDAVGADRRVLTVVGGMWLSAYLPTRTFELLAHSLDLAAATGVDLDPPASVLDSGLRTAVGATARAGDGVALFRHLLGRPGGGLVPLFG